MDNIVETENPLYSQWILTAQSLALALVFYYFPISPPIHAIPEHLHRNLGNSGSSTAVYQSCQDNSIEERITQSNYVEQDDDQTSL